MAATIRNYLELPEGENYLQLAVAIGGPISVGVLASVKLQKYKGGVFYDKTCNEAGIGHAFLVVGYTPVYWIIKNR